MCRKTLVSATGKSIEMNSSKIYSAESFSSFYTKLNECRKMNDYTDVQIQVGESVFPAHRLVLQVMCPVLSEMMSKLSSDKNAVLELDEKYIHESIVEDLLEFLYSSKVCLSAKNISFLCAASKNLNIFALSEVCSRFFIDGLSSDNVLNLYFISDVYELDTLRQKSLEYIISQSLSNFEAWISSNTDLLLLSRKKFEMFMLDLLDTHKNNTNDQSTGLDFVDLLKVLFKAVIKWVEHDYQERFLVRAALLRYIPFNKLPRIFVKKFLSDFNNLEHINEMSSYDKFSSHVLGKIVQVTEMERLYTLSDQGLVVFETFDTRWQREIHIDRMHFTELHNLNYHGWTSLGSKIYFCTFQIKRVNTFKSYDCLTEVWTSLKSLPRSRQKCAIESLNGFIYVTGGSERKNRFDPDYEISASAFRFDHQTDQWETVQDMIIERRSHRLVALNGLLYAIGGEGSNQQVVEEVEEYDPSTDKWTIVTNFAGKSIHAVAHKEHIYVHTEESFQTYFPKTKQWKNLTPLGYMNTSIYADIRAILSMNGKVHALVGEPKKTFLLSYDDFTNQWESVSRRNFLESSSTDMLALVVRPEERIERSNRNPKFKQDLEKSVKIFANFTDSKTRKNEQISVAKQSSLSNSLSRSGSF